MRARAEILASGTRVDILQLEVLLDIRDLLTPTPAPIVVSPAPETPPKSKLVRQRRQRSDKGIRRKRKAK